MYVAHQKFIHRLSFMCVCVSANSFLVLDSFAVMILKLLIAAILIIHLQSNIVTAVPLPAADVPVSPAANKVELSQKIESPESRKADFWVWPLIKRGEGPQLSVVSPLDVLRQQLIYELARRRIKENREQIEENEQILRNLGKRSVNRDDDELVSLSSSRNARSLPNHYFDTSAPPLLHSPSASSH